MLLLASALCARHGAVGAQPQPEAGGAGDDDAEASCLRSTRWFPGVQLHDLHPAVDIGNRVLPDATACAGWCCEVDDCVCFFYTDAQPQDAQNCAQGEKCCWIKPTFNASRTRDYCANRTACASGVVDRG